MMDRRIDGLHVISCTSGGTRTIRGLFCHQRTRLYIYRGMYGQQLMTYQGEYECNTLRKVSRIIQVEPMRVVGVLFGAYARLGFSPLAITHIIHHYHQVSVIGI